MSIPPLDLHQKNQDKLFYIVESIENPMQDVTSNFEQMRSHFDCLSELEIEDLTEKEVLR